MGSPTGPYENTLPLVADALVRTGNGLLHSVTFSCKDAAPTAGSVILYDNTSEAGVELLSVFFSTTWFAPVTLILDFDFSTGLYVGFTTTADVNVTVAYK